MQKKQGVQSLILPCQSGVTSIEYAIIAASIALIIIVSVGVVGGSLSGIFEVVTKGFR